MRTRPLSIQNLEDRKLMAADLSGGLLTVTGDAGDDHIEVAQETRFTFVNVATAATTASRFNFGKPIAPATSVPVFRDEVVVRFFDDEGNVESEERFDSDSVSELRLRGLGGDDTLVNRTSIPSRIYGHSGNDTLIGGSANDRLYGSTGNDELFGMAGDDYLSGSSHNDLLSGGDGDDSLWGGSGTDGLLGGTGFNNLRGQSGADRFLDHDQHVNSIRDKSGDDVTVRFRDVEEGSRPFVADLVNGEIGDGQWEDHEIEAVDRAFQDLEDRVGNNSLLRTSWGSEYHFFRTSDAEVGFAGYNTLEGTIILNDGAFDSGQSFTSEVTFHEIAHSWHFHRFTDWLALSDWREETVSNIGDGVVNFFVGVGNFFGGDFADADALANHDHVDGSSWWFSQDAEFFSEYAKTNPPEDFAESFAYVMMDSAGLTFDSDLDVPMGRENLSARLVQKFDFIDSFLDERS